MGAPIVGWLIAPSVYDGAAFGFRTACWLASTRRRGTITPTVHRELERKAIRVAAI